MWLAAAAPALLALHLLAWLVSATPDHLLGTALASGMLGEGALGTALGRVEIARLSLALLALWALGLARRPRLALVFAAAAVLLSGATGHANAIHPAWAIPVKAAHLLAAAAWLGGLVWLVWLVTGDPADHATFRREAARVSSAALLAFLVVATSGVVATLLFLSSPADVLRSAYGAVVLAKVVGLGALALFGAYHRLRILPALPVDDRAEPRASAGANSGARLARSTQRELGVMGAVILLGGLLAYVPTPAPPVEPDPHAAHVHAPHTTPS